jgi:hypothetical protein
MISSAALPVSAKLPSLLSRLFRLLVVALTLAPEPDEAFVWTRRREDVLELRRFANSVKERRFVDVEEHRMTFVEELGSGTSRL